MHAFFSVLAIQSNVIWRA